MFLKNFLSGSDPRFPAWRPVGPPPGGVTTSVTPGAAAAVAQGAQEQFQPLRIFKDAAAVCHQFKAFEVTTEEGPDVG